MLLEYKQAQPEDARLLVDIYNASFYEDFLRYGQCPGYGKTIAEMERSIRKVPKFVIVCDGTPVGVISCKELEKHRYEIGCLCVIPAFQGKGIGTSAMRFLCSHYSDWQKLTLVTPADKAENVRFYTEKCLFQIDSTEMDGEVTVYRFVRER